MVVKIALVVSVASGFIKEELKAFEEHGSLLEIGLTGLASANRCMLDQLFTILIMASLVDGLVKSLLLNLGHLLGDIVKLFFKLAIVGQLRRIAAEKLVKYLQGRLAVESKTFRQRNNQVITHACCYWNLVCKSVLKI